MIDMRRLLPVGTTMVQYNGTETLCIYSREDGKARVLAVDAILAARKEGRTNTKMVGVGDIATKPLGNFVQTDTDNYNAGMFERKDANVEQNKPHLQHKDMPQTDVAVILAPGTIPDDLDCIHKTTVIAVSSAINTHSEYVDYAVISDPLPVFHPDHPEDIAAVLCAQCHPNSFYPKWRDVTWYSHALEKFDGIPQCCSTEGVITDALWFAVKQLGAKKVILLGVEQPNIVRNYFWEGVFLQAHCYWYSRDGVEIWNCTHASSVIAGVILGSLEEALHG